MNAASLEAQSFNKCYALHNMKAVNHLLTTTSAHLPEGYIDIEHR